MDAHVAALHCRYRVHGEASAAARLADELDRRVRPGLARALGESLEEAFAGDPAVYVLRRVTARLALDAGAPTAARRWGEKLAGAVVRGVAGDPDDGANLARFENQADYVACFVADVLGSGAWGRWFYFPFRDLRERHKSDVLRHVLLDNVEELPEILARLARRGKLGELLDSIDAATAALLWQRGFEALPASETAAELWRPLFAAALRLAESLGVEPMGESEVLFGRFLAGRPGNVDWQSRRELAESVFEALRFLLPERLPEEAPPAGRASRALGELDWLDTEWLEKAIAALPAGRGETRTEASKLPVRPSAAALTPRMRELLDDLAELLATGSAPWLDRARPDSAANALRLCAALFARAPRWQGESLVAATVERLLAAWAALAAAPSPTDVLGSLALGDVETALAALPEGVRSRATGSWRSMVRLGPPGLVVLRALAGSPEASPPARGQSMDIGTAASSWEEASRERIGFETPYAGLFLLWRAVRDFRLRALLRQADWPSDVAPESVLAALGLRWAGAPEPDAALAAFAGLRQTPTLEGLRDACSRAGAEDLDRFEQALLRAAAGHRLVDGTRLSAAALASLEAGRLGLPEADLTFALASVAVLRLWARWLPRFGASSVPFLLEHFIRRRGRLFIGERRLEVELEPSGFDVVLEMAGYLGDLETPGERRVSFSLRRSS